VLGFVLSLFVSVFASLLELLADDSESELLELEPPEPLLEP